MRYNVKVLYYKLGNSTHRYAVASKCVIVSGGNSIRKSNYKMGAYLRRSFLPRDSIYCNCTVYMGVNTIETRYAGNIILSAHRINIKGNEN